MRAFLENSSSQNSCYERSGGHFFLWKWIVTCQQQILKFLEDGEKKTCEILNAISGSKWEIRKNLDILSGQETVIKVKRGLYKLNPDIVKPVIRLEKQNEATVNRLLNLYDKVLERYEMLIDKHLKDEDTLEKKTDLLNNFKALGSMADPLMKRWYLVHRGYDANTRQAQEDAKAKTVAREKEEHANAPLEDTIVEVGHYHGDVKELWDKLPKTEQEQRTV